jgi:hypothetical protein
MSEVSLVKFLIIVYQLHEENTVYKMDEPVSVKCVTAKDVWRKMIGWCGLGSLDPGSLVVQLLLGSSEHGSYKSENSFSS